MWTAARFFASRRITPRILLSRQQTTTTRTLLTVGIARESINLWESRAPLTPSQVKTLLQAQNNHQKKKRLQFVVQPSGQRIFPNHAYAQAGAAVQDDLAAADVILGVKRPRDPSSLLPFKTYLFFSHTVKGQAENMDLLQTCLAQRIQLLDYELMLQQPDDDNNNDNNNSTHRRRLVSFGRFAGLAGSFYALHALGRKLLYRHGALTPLLACPASIRQHDSLAQAKARMAEIGQRIQKTDGMGDATTFITEPLVIAVTGKGGSVHAGAMEILQLLPHQLVSVKELPGMFASYTGEPQHNNSMEPQRQIYLCPVAMSDVLERTSNGSGGAVSFDETHYRNHPAEYRSVFASRVAPYVHAIINAVYWDTRFPRLLTKAQTQQLCFLRGSQQQQNEQQRLAVVADISCDVHGSMEFLERTTTTERPFYQYDPALGREVASDIGETGIAVLGLDILPTELAAESSAHFGETVSKIVQELMVCKEQAEETEMGTTGIPVSLLPPGLKNSCITTPDGQLATKYRYLRSLMDKAAQDTHSLSSHSMVLSLEGHLFDSGLINQIADVIESHSCGLSFRDCVFPAHSATERTKSSVILVVSGNSDAILEQVESKIRTLAKVIEKSDTVVTRTDRPSLARVSSPKTEKRVLVLGAGRVSKTCVSRLSKHTGLKLTVVCDADERAEGIVEGNDQVDLVRLDITDDLHRLSSLVENCDLVLSILPAPLHPLIATECLVHRKHLVTASYESEELRSLQQRAENAGVIFLNEVGLDPGLDHMSAMKIIDDIQSRGGHVTSFSSFCGGVPAPEAADNPLKYKFSWNPMGVIRACQSDACFRWEGQERKVPGRELLQSAFPFHHAWPELDLEYLPNRDSLHYGKIYGIEDADTLFRGTIRYHGFSSLMNVFQNMGLFDVRRTDAKTWGRLLDELRSRLGGFENLHDFVAACSGDVVETAERVTDALQWLGVDGDSPVPVSNSVAEAFCKELEERLRYKEGERDMVIKHHTVEAKFDDRFEERHCADLQVFGDDTGSAMAKTVGYTAAAAAELILDGKLEGRRGLMLPTESTVYEPLLKKVAEDNIVFEEGLMVNPLRPEEGGLSDT